MRLVLVVILAGVLAGCAGESKHPTWSNATGAEQNERLLWKALQDKDWSNVERRLSPTFVGVNASGQAFDRAGWLAYWKNSQVREFSLGDVAVLPEGPDMKVRYVLQASGAAADKSAGPAGGVQVVSIWQETGALGDCKKPFKSGWMLIATTMTPIQGN